MNQHFSGDSKKKFLQKTKDAFCAIIAILILFGSMLVTLGEFIVRNGEGIAVLYFFLWLWAMHHVIDNREVASLQKENEYLRDTIDFYKGIKRELESIIEDIGKKDIE